MKNRFPLCLPALALALSPLGAGPGLTVYNENFAVVRDEVPLRLDSGTTEVRYSGVTSQLEPESVVLRDPSGEVALRVLEQSYRADPANQERLLQMFEGETIRFLQIIGDAETVVEGRIIRAPGRAASGALEPIIEVDGELRTRLPGQPLFPGLGDDSILQPTLSWKIHAPETAALTGELSYLTRGMSWEADYNFILPEKGDDVAMNAWVSVLNESGKTFRGARIKLIAGDVNKIQEQAKGDPFGDMLMARSAEAPPPVEERKFDEFHLYTLPGEIDLRDRETKQLEFARADPIRTTRLYVYEGAVVHGRSGSPGGGVNNNPGFGKNSRPDVAVYREFENSEDNNLGIPLPAGTVRFYRTDIDGQLEFVGEDTIDHTPKNETVRLYLGNAFDLVGERTQTDFFRHRTQDMMRESFSIEIRNRSEEAVTVEAVEPLYRAVNWEILESSLPYEKIDARTIRFPVEVPAEKTRTVTYTVEYTW
ncbi:MAG: DUF4139 domain-containing protein [Puniceicoccaceae bacterium]